MGGRGVVHATKQKSTISFMSIFLQIRKEANQSVIGNHGAFVTVQN